MIDYKLSEIKAECLRYAVCKSSCAFHSEKWGCKVKKALGLRAEKYPSDWVIEGDAKQNESKT